MKAALETSRLFFAVWPPRAAAEALHAWALEARRATGGRVTQVESIHLTLAFLGEVTDQSVSALKSLAVSGERHRLPIDEARYWARNHIVWAGPHETPRVLQALASSLGLELRKKNCKTENKDLSAHVTLIRKAREPRQLPPLPAVNWPVEELVLVRSQLSADGSRYETLASFALT